MSVTQTQCVRQTDACWVVALTFGLGRKPIAELQGDVVRAQQLSHQQLHQLSEARLLHLRAAQQVAVGLLRYLEVLVAFALH